MFFMSAFLYTVDMLEHMYTEGPTSDPSPEIFPESYDPRDDLAQAEERRRAAERDLGKYATASIAGRIINLLNPQAIKTQRAYEKALENEKNKRGAAQLEQDIPKNKALREDQLH